MIYLVEDDDSIRDLVVYTLNTMGLATEGFLLPSLFFQALENATPDLVLLDIMLPEQDGITILQRLRNNPTYASLPIIMLTAKSTEYDRVVGLDKGADDYICKPFGMMELVARIKALLRRTAVQPDAQTLQVESITLSPDKREVRVCKKPIELSMKEFDLLYRLMQSPNTVLTRDLLHDEIWGYDFDGESRTVDVHIRYLRQKLGDAGDLIKTVRGVGYKIGGVDE